MKISSDIRTYRARAAYQGFTLIELLVVISIIAVLAGLLFPAMGAVRTMARKTSAKNDVTQIVTAIKGYYTDYGRYPGVTASTGGSNETETFDNNNGTLIGILRGSVTGTSNPRAVRFLEVPNAKDGRSGLVTTNPTGGGAPTVSTTANWQDPWRRPYVIFISKSYSGSIITNSLTPTSFNATLNTEVAAASRGKDDDSIKGDPVVSWQ